VGYADARAAKETGESLRSTLASEIRPPISRDDFDRRWRRQELEISVPGGKRCGDLTIGKSATAAKLLKRWGVDDTASGELLREVRAVAFYLAARHQ